jgi:hypothetical protein
MQGAYVDAGVKARARRQRARLDVPTWAEVVAYDNTPMEG